MEAAPDDVRTRMALLGFGYAHAAILLGVIVAAVGIEAAIAHPGDELETEVAVALTGGVALYVVGDVWFRRILGVSRGPWRFAGAAAMALGVPVGMEFSGAA